MIKILLVDDEKTERDGIRFLIDRFKFPLEISEAANGKAALEYIKTYKTDILFTDVKMPYMDGLELAKAVNEYDKNIVIIIFSAYSEFEYARKACEANAVNYLLKPIEVDEFKEIMEKAVRDCEEKKKWELQKESMLLEDKKLLLYKLLHRSRLHLEYLERLKQYGIELENKNIVLISVETSGKYFEVFEEEFESILKHNIFCKYENINVLPNLNYIMLYGSAPVSEEKLERMVKKIYYQIHGEVGETVSFIVGRGFHKIEELQANRKEIEALREDTFRYFGGILYVAKIHKEDKNRVLGTEEVKERIHEHIEAKNIAKIEDELAQYIKILEQEKSSSALYVKYVLLDMVKALYLKFGIYNDEVLFETTESIMKCSYLKEMEQILQDILKKVKSMERSQENNENTTVSEIKIIIANEYMEDIGLEDLANRVCRTPAYLSYVFKQETGTNIVKYLTDYRMNKAKELLEQGSLKIIDIGKHCGYQNQPYFNRLFKNYFGMTPKQYREQGGKA